MTSWELLREIAVRFWAAIPVKLPGAADLFDHVEVNVRNDELVLVFTAGGEEVSARIHDVRGPVELADVPGRLGPDAIRGRDEIAVRHGVRRLLELPEILREARDGGGGIEDDLRAVQAEKTRTLWEMSVIADI